MAYEGRQSKNNAEIWHILWECAGNGYQLLKLALYRLGSRSRPDEVAVCGLLHHQILKHSVCGKREGDKTMLKITFFLLGVSFCVFAWIMLREPRTLWSGVSLLGVLLCSAVTMFFLLTKYADWLAEHDLLMNILVALLLLMVGCTFVFPVIFIVTLFIEGIKVIRHEGLKPANLLTMLFSVLLYLYLAVWPVIGGLEKGRLGTKLYVLISLAAVYVLALMAIYLLSAALNLFHLKSAGEPIISLSWEPG